MKTFLLLIRQTSGCFDRHGICRTDLFLESFKPFTMKEFVLLIRNIDDNYDDASKTDLELIMKRWENWFGGIAA
jgi:hypothetical protein